MYICIEGNIGAGKTTMARELAKQLKVNYLPERFEENVLLPLFYKDAKTFAFPTEYSFLIDRHKQLVTYFEKPAGKSTVSDFHYFEKPAGKSTVSDFHFDKCLCFAKANLKEKDFLFYKKHFGALKQTLPVPDLIVYLDTSTELLMKNIQKRGRAIEKSLKESYLEKIQRSFDTYYLAKRRSGAPVLHLRLTEYTPATLASSCNDIILALNDLSKNSPL